MEETKGGRGPGGTKREREQHKQKKEIEKIKGAIKIFSHFLCSMFCCETFKKWGETLDHVSCSSLHFFRALTASCVLFNNTEHSQGFSICFITKNPLNSLRITFNFQNKLYFQCKSQSINVVTSGTK